MVLTNTILFRRSVSIHRLHQPCHDTTNLLAFLVPHTLLELVEYLLGTAPSILYRSAYQLTRLQNAMGEVVNAIVAVAVIIIIFRWATSGWYPVFLAN